MHLVLQLYKTRAPVHASILSSDVEGHQYVQVFSTLHAQHWLFKKVKIQGGKKVEKKEANFDSLEEEGGEEKDRAKVRGRLEKNNTQT